jgi:hypothetical protein
MLPSIILSLFLFSALSGAAAPPSPRDPIHIPVLRRRHVRRDGSVPDHYTQAAARLRKKYGYNLPVSRRAQTVDMALTDQVRHFVLYDSASFNPTRKQ